MPASIRSASKRRRVELGQALAGQDRPDRFGRLDRPDQGEARPARRRLADDPDREAGQLDRDVAQGALGRERSTPEPARAVAAAGRPGGIRRSGPSVVDRHVIEDAVLPEVGQEAVERLGLGPEEDRPIGRQEGDIGQDLALRAGHERLAAGPLGQPLDVVGA